MNVLDRPTVAVIADAHLHDIHSDYDGASLTLADQQLTLRTWADTRRSSRVFNESRMALLGTLDDIVKRGVKHVVLLGDYSDDGQVEAVQNVVVILRQYRINHGIHFYALPGNHDYYGPAGKHQSTRFATSAQKSVLVTSDPNIAKEEPDSAVLTQKMFCLGAPEGLLPMAEFGFCRQSTYLHWETPFGTSDKFDDRQYSVSCADGSLTRQLVDASYLVEPSPGLWLLMLDTNVFEPRNGTWDITQKKAFIDSSGAGWNSVLRNKPYLFEWISDVCTRAKDKGKHLLTFSHYPALDPYNDTHGGYLKLFGETEVSRRQPIIEVAQRLLDTGLHLHFGGHMHINGVSRHCEGKKQMTHISVPSLVNCPAAYQLVHADITETHVDTISIAHLPVDPKLVAFYTEETNSTNTPAEPALTANSYGDFLYKRIHSRVLHRHFKKNWPQDIVLHINESSVADLLVLFSLQKNCHEPLRIIPKQALAHTELVAEQQSLAFENSPILEDLFTFPLMQLIVDWYCLRDAGSQALDFIKPETRQMYTGICALHGNNDLTETKTTADFFAVFLAMMHDSLRALPPNPARVTITLTTP